MEEEGVFPEPYQDSIADNIYSYAFFIYIFLLRFFTAILTFGLPTWNFTHHFKMPTTTPPSTRLVHYALDEGTTRRLLQRCKMEGVSLNSAFTAAANLGMYQMMLQRKPSMAATRVATIQAINMRRYWPKQLQQNGLGCHISLLDVDFPVKQDNLHNFWSYSREVHERLNSQLIDSKKPLKVQPMSERLMILIRHNAWLSMLGLPTANDAHYTVTNMGNLSQSFPGCGEVVEASRVLRSVNCHHMPSLCQHTLQTFRGRLAYSLDYYTQKMTKETAEMYASNILEVLRSSIHLPN